MRGVEVAGPGPVPAPAEAPAAPADWNGVLGRLAAAVAHEIRNPLAAMTNAASLLREAARPGTEEAQLIGILLEESQRMNRIVGEFLALARPAAVSLGPCSVQSVVFSTVTLLEKDPRYAGRISLEVDVQSGLAPIRADSDRLREALWNLLLNAAEAAGPCGAVRLSARLEERGSRAGVTVRVDDSGPGVPADQRERVFQPFETTKPGGTGLGLAWARRIAEVHGGRIGIGESELGGARVSLWLATAGPGQTQGGR